MKVLVTGANGYLGRGIVERLIELGAEVTAVDYHCELVNPKANIVECDLFGVEDPYTFFGRPDVLLHLAWRNGFVHNAATHLGDLDGHYRFIETMASSGIDRIAVMGSMHEIGFYEGCIHEDTPCNPQNLYGIAKDALRKATEYICNTKKVKLQWLRGYYIVSNTTIGNSIFSKLTAANQEGKEKFPFTTGKNQYDFLDYGVFCNQVACAAMQDKILGNIEICSGSPERLSERVERFIIENNFKIKLEYGAFPDRPYDSKAVWGDNKKISEILAAQL